MSVKALKVFTARKLQLGGIVSQPHSMNAVPLATNLLLRYLADPTWALPEVRQFEESMRENIGKHLDQEPQED